MFVSHEKPDDFDTYVDRFGNKHWHIEQDHFCMFPEKLINYITGEVTVQTNRFCCNINSDGKCEFYEKGI
jgi:hypothetical protein